MRLKLAALLTLYTKQADSADIAARPTHPVRERLGRGPTHRLENQGVDVALEYAFVQVQSNYIQSESWSSNTALYRLPQAILQPGGNS
jgi:hypothetical protein